MENPSERRPKTPLLDNKDNCLPDDGKLIIDTLRMPFAVIYGRYFELEDRGLSPNLTKPGCKSHALQIGDEPEDSRTSALELLNAAKNARLAVEGEYVASQNRTLEGYYILCSMLTYTTQTQAQEPRIIFITRHGDAYQHYESNVLTEASQVRQTFARIKAAALEVVRT